MLLGPNAQELVVGRAGQVLVGDNDIAFNQVAPSTFLTPWVEKPKARIWVSTVGEISDSAAGATAACSFEQEETANTEAAQTAAAANTFLTFMDF